MLVLRILSKVWRMLLNSEYEDISNIMKIIIFSPILRAIISFIISITASAEPGMKFEATTSPIFSFKFKKGRSGAIITMKVMKGINPKIVT